MRACIILGVVCVHIIAYMDVKTRPFSNTNIGLDMLTMTFHFTREAFMLITGLVLFYTYYDKQFTATSFWKKRFFLIAIPYIFWTAAYILFTGTYLRHFNWAPIRLFATFIHGLLSANQFFLYFLMVSMQLYAVFPLMLWFIKKTSGYHAWIFIGSFLLQIGIMFLNQTVIPTLNLAHLPAWLSLIVHYKDRFILSYQFWFVAGAIGAIHYAKVRQWMMQHAKWAGVGFGVILLGLWATYLTERFGLHFSDANAIQVLQPIMIPYSFMVAVLLWLLGLSWVKVRLQPHMTRISKVIRFFGGVSFGIFLLHPFALHYVEVLNDNLHLPFWIHLCLIPVMALCVYVSAGFAAYVIGKIPFISYVVGEKTKRPLLQKPIVTPNVVNQ